MPNLIQLFETQVHLLSASELHVLYTLENMNSDQYHALTLIQLAKLANVSTTTVIRMCHKMNLDGFSELKYSLLSLPSTVQNPMSFFQQIESLKQNQPVYKTIADQLIEANKVLIIGVGLSKPIAEYLSKLLLQSGKDSRYIYDSHILTLLPQSVKKNDLIIYISSSGKTKTIHNVASQLYHKQCHTVGITNQFDQQLQQYCDIYLTTDVPSQQINHFDVTPRSYLMFVVDMIFEHYLHAKE